MALHDELLALAKELVDRNLGSPVLGDLRRGVSTAYYALFHLLVHEGTVRLVGVAALRARVARSFDHKTMRQVCQDFARLTPDGAGRLVYEGNVIPPEVQNVAIEFVTLQQARHQADYDTTAAITQVQAQTDVFRAEYAFSEWAAVSAHPGADAFLAELWCRGIPKR